MTVTEATYHSRNKFIRFVVDYQSIGFQLRTSKLNSFESIELFLALIQKAFKLLELPYTKHNMERVDWAIRQNCIEEYFHDVDRFVSVDTDQDLKSIIRFYKDKRPAHEPSDVISLMGYRLTLNSGTLAQSLLNEQLSFESLLMKMEA
jgi:hypothetical protein